jgi:hypothetical protein
VLRREGDEGVVGSERGSLRFTPGGDLTDTRGGTWSVTGDHAALDLSVTDGVVRSREYPHALARLWSALDCSRTGDVLVSAEPSHEFIDWGGHAHTGGGSHGSLHRCDSVGVLLTCGIDMPEREQWSIEDVTPLVLDHMGVAA